MSPEGDVARARSLLAEAASIVVLTGAGISAESGVPTFRGEGGLWKTHRAEDLATPEAFRSDPRLVWEWYGWRRDLVSRCAPNAGHVALARLALGRRGVTLITQNVDGLHEAAARAEAGTGDPSAAVPLELHGSLYRVRCARCGQRASDRSAIDATSLDSLPRCAQCTALLRPDIVWFGEALDAAVIDAAFRAAESADVCVVAGTSALVHPAASLPLATARAGGTVIEVNPDPTPLTPIATVSLRAPSGEILPRIV